MTRTPGIANALGWSPLRQSSDTWRRNATASTATRPWQAVVRGLHARGAPRPEPIQMNFARRWPRSCAEAGGDSPPPPFRRLTGTTPQGKAQKGWMTRPEDPRSVEAKPSRQPGTTGQRCMRQSSPPRPAYRKCSTEEAGRWRQREAEKGSACPQSSRRGEARNPPEGQPGAGYGNEAPPGPP